MTIRILPEKVSSAIAAGEVIERPASVVKELVENALDAGAHHISIETEQAGVGQIRVADDGAGIPISELELAVARFTTSKLETADDLARIATLGFRGEALSSIGAISKLELISRTAQTEQGARLVVEAGSAGKVEAFGAPAGTEVRVTHLFQNVPARRKFLKSETTEKRWIYNLVTRYAIAYPQVSFHLEQDHRLALETTGNGDAREAFAQVFGLEIARAMLGLPPVDQHQQNMAVSGFISPPSISRGNRREITFFVNGRWIQDGGLSAAIAQAYHTLLMVGRFPIVFLNLELPPETVDVNVHPAKAEVRFQDQSRVFSLVQRSVRGTLIGQAPASSSFSSWPSWSGTGQQDPAWMLAGSLSSDMEEQRLIDFQPALPNGEMPLLRAVGQVGAAYLVAEGPDGLYLIDQHAAHERVLYDQSIKARADGSLASQGILEPINLELSPAETELLEAQLELLPALGFEIEHFGQRTFRLRAMPAILQAREPEQALRSLIGAFEEDETPFEGEQEARLIARICKRSAVKAGQVLSLVEQQQLLRDLEASTAPRTCPHGRPTLIHISVDNLERQFGRR